MLQRNTGDHALDVPAIPITLQPGDSVDWPDPIMGCTPVPSPAKTARTTKSPAVAAGDEGTIR